MTDSIEQVFANGKQSVSLHADAPVESAWALLASPARWPSWAPHIRRVESADGRGPAPTDIAEGLHLRIHGVGPVAVRATITHVEDERRWDFAVDLPGPWRVVNAHLVEPEAGGCRVTVTMALDGPAGGVLSRTVLAAYVPLAAYAIRRLARLAASDDRTTRAALQRLGEQPPADEPDET